MEYKVGDRLLCKKNYEDTIFEGKYYIIILKSLDYNNDYVLTFKDNNGDPFIMFYFEIKHYFYTENELRKIKLERLNESR